jgi:UDPglucose 6-dehydrogenase
MHDGAPSRIVLLVYFIKEAKAVRIAMIGGGYVGLVSGACFAEFGMDVALVEADATKLASLRAGRIPIFEPGLDRLVAENVSAGRLTFGDNLAEAVSGAEAVFIAVGTPTRRGDGHADLTYVFAAVEQVAHALSDYAVVVTKSTVPVGTGRRIAEIIRSVRPDLTFDVASNPEFLREGSAIGDFMRPDRVVIGCESDRAREVLRRLYRPLSLIEAPVLFTGIETAELTKYAANSFLAMKVTFINEMADLCEKLGADVHDIARGIGLDGRIGRKFLHPGPGFGGSCFPKDTLALVRIAQEAGAPSRLVETVVSVNDARKAGMSSRIVAACGGSVRGKTIAVLGLTFKPETDDMRDSPSVPIVSRLAEDGATVRAFDPEGMEQARPMLPAAIHYCTDVSDAISGADILVIVTEWNEFRALQPAKLKAAMRGNVIVDLRNVYDPVAMRMAGFSYHSIGRPATS